MNMTDKLDLAIDFLTLGEYGLEEPSQREAPFDGHFSFTDPPERATIYDRAKKKGFDLLDESRVADRQFKQQISVDFHRKVERRQKRRRWSDRA